MSKDLVISVENVSKAYRIWETPAQRLLSPLYAKAARLAPGNLGTRLERRARSGYRDFFALSNVNFEVARGEAVGVIGRNGSGKSTLLQILAGTLQPSGGSLQVRGRVAALLELGSGFNPDFTGRENVMLNATLLGLKSSEIEDRFDSIAAFADIGDFLDEPVKTYSSGMFVRLAFAVVTHVSADILLVDEALAVGDIFFQQKCYAHLARLREKGVAIVLVTHGMNDIEQFCERAYLLDQGKLHSTGPSAEVVKRYYLINQPGAQDAAAPATAPAGAATAPQGFWPGPAAFLDISRIPQVTDGTARCTGIALCNSAGEPCRVFEQGEEADFYYEYELLRPIDIPVAGIVIFNNKQVITHGKNSLEYGADFGGGFGAGVRLRFRHRLRLEIAVGHYTFESGFASISAADRTNAHLMNHLQLNDCVRRHCHLNGLGPFEVTFRRAGRPVQLMHHGVANIPGSMEWIGSVP